MAAVVAGLSGAVWARPRLALAFRGVPWLGRVAAVLAVRGALRRGWGGLRDLVDLRELA